MNVTLARVEDLDDLLELVAAYQELDETANVVDDAGNEAFIRHLIGDANHSALFIGRTRSGEPVGFVSIHGQPSLLDAARIARITDLFVHPDYRMQGFGRQLFDHALRWARSHQHKKIAWYVENMNMTAQYMFDTIENVAQSGGLAYCLSLDERV